MPYEAKDLMGWALEEYKAKHGPIPADVEGVLTRFIAASRELFAKIPVRGLAAAGVGMGLQLGDGSVLLFTNHAQATPGDPGDYEGYNFIGNTPQRGAPVERPTDKPIFGG